MLVSVFFLLLFLFVGINTASAAIVVGDGFGGGVVGYILQPNDPGYDANAEKGLIVQMSDEPTAIWSNVSSAVSGANATAIGTGSSNTNAIVNQAGETSSAAATCLAYSNDGYTDWFLPSKDELNALYVNQAAIGGFSPSTPYWSSSQDSSIPLLVWAQDFSAGAQIRINKILLPLPFRCVRTFSVSKDATLSASSIIKGVSVTDLGTPNSSLVSVTAGSATISTIQSEDTSNTGSYVTSFVPTDGDAMITKVVKYASGADDSNFATDTAYNGTDPISNGDFFVVEVTAADEATELYYEIAVAVTTTEPPTLLSPTSAELFATKPTGTLEPVQFSLPEPMKSGSLTLTFAPASGTPIVMQLSSVPDGDVSIPQTLNINPNGGIETASGVITSTADSIPFGTYDVTLTYQDKAGDPPVHVTATGVTIAGYPSLPTNLGPTNLTNGGSITNSRPTFTFTTVDSNPSAHVGYSIAVSTQPSYSSRYYILSYDSALGTAGSSSFTVGQSAQGGTYQVGSPGQTLPPGKYYWLVSTQTDDGLSSQLEKAWNVNDPNAYSFQVVSPATQPSNNAIVVLIFGCKDPTATNYNPNNGVVSENSLCAYPTASSVSKTNIHSSAPAQSTTDAAPFTFTQNLKKGVDSPNVSQLQKFLDTDGFPVATSGWGSLNQLATIFGSKTVVALKKYQASINLPATGYFGPMTRAYINNLLVQKE